MVPSTYTEILTDYLPEYKRMWNTESQVPYLYNINTAVFVSYDDPQSITLPKPVTPKTRTWQVS